MSCEAISASLVAIDGSGYRAGSPTTLSPEAAGAA